MRRQHHLAPVLHPLAVLAPPDLHALQAVQQRGLAASSPTPAQRAPARSLLSRLRCEQGTRGAAQRRLGRSHAVWGQPKHCMHVPGASCCASAPRCCHARAAARGARSRQAHRTRLPRLAAGRPQSARAPWSREGAQGAAARPGQGRPRRGLQRSRGPWGGEKQAHQGLWRSSAGAEGLRSTQARLPNAPQVQVVARQVLELHQIHHRLAPRLRKQGKSNKVLAAAPCACPSCSPCRARLVEEDRRWRARLLRLTGQLERGRARQRRHRQHVVAQLGGQLYWSKEGRGSTSGCRAAQRVPLHVAASSKTLPAWRRTCSRSRAPPTVTPASSSAGNAGNKSTPGTAAAAAASTSALAGSVMASPCCWCLHGVCVGGGRAVCMRTAS